MKGGFPITWMIFSAVMFNLQFVGIYCGTGWRHVIPLHVQQHTHNKYLEWFLMPPRKPPDPTRTVKLSFGEIDDCNSIKPQNTKYSINNIVYSVSKRSIINSRKGTLIDRGANGGLAGDNVRVLHKTGRKVDVQGIDNHQITNIPIVTAAGVVNTQRGEVILIMHQYAHIPNGKTIHSAGQLEHHGITVDDRSRINGGKQRMITHSGYVIPFNVRSGLVTMDMRPPTDDELNLNGSKSLPQTIITSDLDWNPSAIDYEYDNENWFDAMENLPDLNYDIPFDEYGEYLQTHEIAANFTELEKNFDVQNEYIINAQEAISASKGRKVAESFTDFEEIQPKFGWLPINII